MREARCALSLKGSTKPDALRLAPQAVGNTRRAGAGEGLPPAAAPSVVAVVKVQADERHEALAD